MAVAVAVAGLSLAPAPCVEASKDWSQRTTFFPTTRLVKVGLHQATRARLLRSRTPARSISRRCSLPLHLALRCAIRRHSIPEKRWG